ncbi:uncharacterized protein LOC119265140 isoform X1 [Tachysurus ichikawai]
MMRTAQSSSFKMMTFLMGLQISLLPSSLGQQGHQGALKKAPLFTMERNNIKWEPLMNPQKVLMPPLHIKLDLMELSQL